MTLQTSAPIKLTDIVAEFGVSAPHGLTEYYRSGSLAQDNTHNAGIPTSGAVSLTDFFGGSFSSFTTFTAVDLLLDASGYAAGNGDIEPLKVKGSDSPALVGYSGSAFDIRITGLSHPQNFFTSAELTGTFSGGTGTRTVLTNNLNLFTTASTYTYWQWVPAQYGSLGLMVIGNQYTIEIFP